MAIPHLEYTYHQLPTCFYQDITPKKWPDAKLLQFNSKLAEDINLDINQLSDKARVKFLLGLKLPQKAQPLAQAYAGHQFGYFTYLGDGRALLLGEHIKLDGSRVDLHLKGAGVTQYGRRGDGLAALGPMLREYIISEAMHALGIPTTRSLAVITTGQTVLRDRAKPGAILVRVASSHIRIGTFEYAIRQGVDNLKALFDYTLTRHYPQLTGADNPALALLSTVAEKQAQLITDWQKVGFIHGVMNTDNMALSGETIDYGPCAFMDTYDADCVFSSIDQQGRYAFANQPNIALWNLSRLAETLLPLIDPNENIAITKAKETLEQYSNCYEACWLQMMRKKIGLTDQHKNDLTLAKDLLSIMQENMLDYTKTFYELTYDVEKLTQLKITELDAWIKKWQKHKIDTTLMQTNNPVIIPRNHLVEQALTAAEEGQDISLVESLIKALQTPYANTAESIPYQASPLPDERVHQTFCGT